jgi:predicted nucleic acid-binding protein
LLQGFTGPRARKDLIERFGALPLLSPDRQDHIDAAEVRNQCRRSGVQIGTIDALLAQLCIRHGLTLLSTDQDFVRAASHCPLKLWRPSR